MAKTIISVDIKKKTTEQPTPLHNRWHPDIPPVVTVKPGDDFIVEALDWTGGQIRNDDNASDIRDAFTSADEVTPGQGYLRWTLQCCHPRLAGGQPITLQGCSCLHWRDRVHFHQDYFDAGALLYEHLPVMGTAIRWLKGRLA